jgi:hypothetical protein
MYLLACGKNPVQTICTCSWHIDAWQESSKMYLIGHVACHGLIVLGTAPEASKRLLRLWTCPNEEKDGTCGGVRSQDDFCKSGWGDRPSSAGKAGLGQTSSASDASLSSLDLTCGCSESFKTGNSRREFSSTLSGTAALEDELLPVAAQDLPRGSSIHGYNVGCERLFFLAK